MGGGGLMQLVAYGAQDIYLTGKPQITFLGAEEPREAKDAELPSLERRKRRTKEEMRKATEIPENQSTMFNYFPISANVNPPMVEQSSKDKLPSLFSER